MNGKNEANIGTQATILKTKDTQCCKINTTEEEMVSNYHKPFEINDLNDDCLDMDIRCMHANENNTLPTGMDTEIMKSFVEIAKKTGQLSKIMEFPPIDHDSPIRYVLLYTLYSQFNLYGVSTIISCMIFEIGIICSISHQHTNVATTTTQNNFLLIFTLGYFPVELVIYKT
jgi:hypothetical protein